MFRKYRLDQTPGPLEFQYPDHSGKPGPETLGDKLEFTLLGASVDIDGRDPGGIIIMDGHRVPGDLELLGDRVAVGIPVDAAVEHDPPLYGFRIREVFGTPDEVTHEIAYQQLLIVS